MRAVDLIVKKRDGGVLRGRRDRFSRARLHQRGDPGLPVRRPPDGNRPEGHERRETAHLTRAMIDSGDVIDLSGIPGPLVDKHSTGGVGDKISLVLAPLAAACGLRVPMMSGRSLGHTGGTLDKLESIPGYRTDLSPGAIPRGRWRTIGFAMIGQSETVVPADRRMYALRDVTGTVESIPLITASIMSKKFAEGAQSLVFDVKCGAGAFMKTRERGARPRALPRGHGRGPGPPRRGADHRHGPAAGEEDRQLPRSGGDHRLPQGQGTGRRGGSDLPACRLDADPRRAVRRPDAGEKLAREKLADGSAWELFLQNVEFQGGDVQCVLHPRKAPHAQHHAPLKALEPGLVAAHRRVQGGRRVGDPGRGQVAQGRHGSSRSGHHAR